MTNEEDGQEDAPLLDECVPDLPTEIEMHDRATSGALRDGSTSMCSKRCRSGSMTNPHAMRTRRETVEHPFGTLKMRMGATHFLMKTLPKVATEMALCGARLQSDARDQHRRRAAAHCGDEGVRWERISRALPTTSNTSQ